ncbi:helix-turn-helix domain-containing protein [Neobacillus jeddahensis]|uniref:helix-turn-helix domain-containing protein n=1 Tax=Neobacillus jeddahensis TaxID=1461580 RepID=UPI00058DB66F|nr:helix-turn-helix domain-containing protein [Neobacillus jeddahensis]
MEGKWLIADRDLNEREGLKWLLKTSSIPVSTILLAANYQELIGMFEKETPDIVLLELDMLSKEEWTVFRDLLLIYNPVLLLTSAEATFEKARATIDMQALDLLIKPFSSTKVKSAYQKASRRLTTKVQVISHHHHHSYKDLSYENLFLAKATTAEQHIIAVFQTEMDVKIVELHTFLTDYPFTDQQRVFVLSDMVVLLFHETCRNIKEQCQKAMRMWEEESSEPLAIVVYKGKTIGLTLNQQYLQTRKMMEFTYYQGYRQVFEFDASPEWAHIDPFLTPPEQKQWVDMLTNLEMENIKKWLYAEFLQLRHPYPDPGLVRIRLTSILAQIRRFMKTYQLNEEPSYELAYRTIFDSILYDTVLYRTVQNLILFNQNIFLGVERCRQNRKQDVIERSITYLEANFSNQRLRLEDVAQFVERNPAYFSHLLITKTGASFTEVLQRIRMKEAKRLLTETNKPIKEIALLVGYQNANYFSKLFKEANHLSPREFRTQKHQH